MFVFSAIGFNPNLNNMTVGEYEICLEVILVYFTWESGSLVLIASLHDWADQCKPLAN